MCTETYKKWNMNIFFKMTVCLKSVVNVYFLEEGHGKRWMLYIKDVVWASRLQSHLLSEAWLNSEGSSSVLA